MLGVSVETLRRWEAEGRLQMERSEGGQRLVDLDDVSRLLDERRKSTTDRPIVAQSARNRFPGIVTRIETDRIAAVVEVIAGPHRMVSLMTAEAVEDMGLKVGDEAVCVVKATNVIVEVPSARDSEGEAPPRHPSILAVVLGACSSAVASPSSIPAASVAPSTAPSVAPSTAAGGELTVYAAASLKEALDKAKVAYETANPGTTLTISTDSSSALETQIEQGAPADVFLSADTGIRRNWSIRASPRVTR